jgi:hypothetical protein
MLASALTMAAAAPARAEDQAATHEAQVRFEEGLAHVKAGDFEAARMSFVQAYAVLRKPDILWNLALSEEKSGHPADALAHFKALGRDTAGSDADRARAKKHVDDLMTVTGHIEVLAPVGAQVLVDAAPAGLTPLPEPVDVAPGRHHVEVRTAQGWSKTADADALAGQIAHVSFALGDAPGQVAAPTAVPHPAATEVQPASGASPGAPGPTPAPPAPDTVQPAKAGGSTFWDARGITVVSLGGAAVLAGGLGLGFGLQSSSDADTAAALRAQNPNCNGPSTLGCQKLQSTTDAQHGEHVTSTALWVTSGVFAVGAVATWFLWPRASGAASGQTVSVVPSVGAGSAGVSAVGTF